jgi:NADH-quinone oxidoreductase subunit F
LKRIANLLTRNFNKYNPDNFEQFMNIDGFEALIKSIKMNKEFIISEIESSGLMGRGGAAYPSGKKMREFVKYKGENKYIICNADEGEPGTFKDRSLLELDPYSIIEGMIITAFAVGATVGYVYIREEYSYLVNRFDQALSNSRKNGFLGEKIQNIEFNFDIKVFIGAGAYICGEGTSLIESIEGKPGRPRIKPPNTKEKGLFNQPTLIYNVETLTAIKTIMRFGSDEFSKYGTEKSKGTKLISLCGNVKNPGTYEVPFGITLREIVYDLGGGILNDKQLKFLQIGGVSGAIFPAKLIDTPLTYEDFKELGFSIGSGAILVADNSVNMLDFLGAVGAFFYHESCGKCTPCREGNRQLLNIYSRLKSGTALKEDAMNIEKIAKVMKNASFCGLGQTAPTALLTAIDFCPEEIFRRSVQHE